MSIFEANTYQIASAGKAISQLGDDYNANIKNIYSVIGNLSEAWSGGASDQYKIAFQSYQGDLNNLGNAITGMGRVLQSAATTFNDNEDELASQASKL